VSTSDAKLPFNRPVSAETPRSSPVNVRILEREYIIGVKPTERASLMAAARALEVRMREIRNNNRTAAVDRVAVLVALNLAHELHLLREELTQQQVQFQTTLSQLNEKLDQAIEESQ